MFFTEFINPIKFRNIQISCFFKNFVKCFFCFVILGITARFIEKIFLKFLISLSGHMTSVMCYFSSIEKGKRKEKIK